MDERDGAFSRKENWYYKGWEKQERVSPEGKKTVDWVYVGDRYDFAEGTDRLRVKTTFGVCAAFLVLIYAVISLSPATGGRVAYVCYPETFAVIPVLYFCMGVFWLIYTKGSMTFRRLHSSVERIKWSSVAGGALMGWSTAAEAVNLLRNSEAASSLWDWVYLIGCAVCAGEFLLAWQTLKKNPTENIGKINK